MRKRLQQLSSAKHNSDLVCRLAKLERSGLAFCDAVQELVLDLSLGQYRRRDLARILVLARGQAVVEVLLRQFFSLEEKVDLWETALTLEGFGDLRAVGPLIAALQDANLHRRQTAARTLGWIGKPGTRAVIALSGVLTDNSQPIAVREEAAESLAYLPGRNAIPALISVLKDEAVQVRFWSVFALGGIYQSTSDARIVPALESMLGDPEVTPGNWWSVGREALAMLAKQWPPVGDYRRVLEEEAASIQANANASAEDRRWAESYG